MLSCFTTRNKHSLSPYSFLTNALFYIQSASHNRKDYSNTLLLLEFFLSSWKSSPALSIRNIMLATNMSHQGNLKVPSSYIQKKIIFKKLKLIFTTYFICPNISKIYYCNMWPIWQKKWMIYFAFFFKVLSPWNPGFVSHLRYISLPRRYFPELISWADGYHLGQLSSNPPLWPCWARMAECSHQ